MRGLPNKIPPETIRDESPLIRSEHTKDVRALSSDQICNILHRYMAQAGFLGSKVGKRYTIRPHSIRKFFRTQMAALGAQIDYIEYMIGHTARAQWFLNRKSIAKFLQTCSLLHYYLFPNSL